MKFITKNPLKRSSPKGDRTIRDYKKGQIILHSEDTIDSVSRVTEGWVEVYDFDVNGNKKILLLLGPGDLLPIVWQGVEDEELRYSYEAITDLRLSWVSYSVFEKQLSEDHDLISEVLNFSQSITRQLLLRAEAIEATTNSLRILQTMEYLLIKTSPKPNRKSVEVPFKITHEMIANMSGMTRESVSKEIKRLTNQGIVDYTGRSQLKIYREPLHFELQ